MTTGTFSLLGLGAMGQALGRELLTAGSRVTVWNRTPGKDTDLLARGAVSADTAPTAVAGASLVIVCLLDYTSVRNTLDPMSTDLSGKAVVNLTSTTPEEARGLADWARDHEIAYLDGAILATPEMIGKPASRLLYSGAQPVYDEHRAVLECFGAAEYFGDDAGTASLWDFALLGSMYSMFAGVMHGAAMLSGIGVTASEFAPRAVEWLTAMLTAVPHQAAQIDEGGYQTDVQNLDFNKAAIDAIVRASRDAGVDPAVVESLRNLINRQVAAGQGEQAFSRVYESIRTGD